MLLHLTQLGQPHKNFDRSKFYKNVKTNSFLCKTRAPHQNEKHKQFITQLNGKETMTLQPNIGIGIKFKGIAIDYALTDIGDASVALYSNIFSLRFDLNPKKPKNE